MPPMTPRSQSPAPTPASKLPPGSPPHAPHGFKALGRRMSQSKPLRMLKSIASKSSLRGHTRRQSASSVRSAHSQNSEADLQGRDSKESEAYPYGKEVAAAQAAPQGETASASGSSIAPPQQEPEQEGKAQPVASAVSVDVQKVETEAKKAEHEAEARQIESVPESTSESETEARTEETNVAQTPSEPAAEATPDAAQAAEAVEQKPEKVADHREEETRDETLETDTRVPAVHDADGLSLSSSSTTVDEVSAPAPVSEVSELKQIKMETDSPVQSVVTPSSPEGGAPAEHDTDINPFVLDDPEEPLSEPEVETTAASSSPTKSATPLAESVVLSTQVDSATSSPARPHVTFAEPPSASSSSSSEDEAPELHTPALTVSTLFLPIPNVRLFVHEVFHLTWWLTTKAVSYPLALWPSYASSRVSRPTP
ncbi:hypothetical protein DFH11DRAFT_1580572 [Phellopilus nigrolimitatus]|nr:hypothetical protein DFH11DRAFT_1580572 [Phellopilus nigrolimitatus]